MKKRWKQWRFKNTILLVISIFLFVTIADSSAVQKAIEYIGTFGYIGVFFVGILFVSTFTVVPAGAVLFYSAQILNPLGVAVIAGAGGVVGDYLMFRFFKNNVFEELKPIFARFEHSHLSWLFSTPYFAWFAPVAGALVIASPLPDEIGISLLGISRLKHWQFIALSFVLNSIGILFIVTLAKSF